MPFPETLDAKPRIIFFTDFDGTITTKDTNDHMTDNHGFGTARRRQLNLDVLHGKDSFRNTFQQMVDSWTTSIPETISILKQNIVLDPGFAEFINWARSKDVPVIVLSSGMVPIIRALLEELLDDKAFAASIEIVANEPQLQPPINDFDKSGGWTIKFHDDSDFGHDKSLTIRPYAQAIAQLPEGHQPRPTLLYAGDGISDLSAARETDLLFAKKGEDLITFCEKEGIPFVVFEDWNLILDKTKQIYEGQADVKQLAQQTLQKVRSKENGVAK